MEILRPRLEKAYEEAIESEKAAYYETKRQHSQAVSLKEETERLQKMKLENSNIQSKNEKFHDIIKLNNTENASMDRQDKYSLPVASTLSSINTFTTPNYTQKETNSTLKSLQERMGISRSDENNSYQFKETVAETINPVKYFSESGEALRPVHIPQCLISKFLNLAAKNTDNNLETCGVLAGKLNHDEFTITCLIIPKQVATSDTCAMINEEEIIIAQDSLDVMSLGWIHVINNI